jgi:hypothetical protein
MLLSRWLLGLSYTGLAAYLLFFFLSTFVPAFVTRRLFDPLAAVAFWGGIPASVALFVVAYFVRERKASIRTMLLALFLGLLWFAAAVACFAERWGTAQGPQP